MLSVRSERTAETLVEPPLSAVEGRNPKRELRVLQVFSNLGVGGAETWLMSLLRYFREQNDSLPMDVKFDILLTGGTKAVFDEEAIALGARLFYVPFTRRKALAFASEFRRILAREKYDAIHDHQDYIAGIHFSMGVGRLPAIRIAHVHTALYHRTRYENDRVLRVAKSSGKRLLASLATHIVGTSKQMVAEYGFDQQRFRGLELGAAHCGFDTSKYQRDYTETHAQLCQDLGWDTQAKIILFVGRLDSEEDLHQGSTTEQKNPGFALDVARRCIANDEKVRLVMVGSGEAKRREFDLRVKTWGLGDKIRLLGVRHDVPRLMCGSDLLLFPSSAEGLGMVVVEAQAAGLRTLASDTTPRECVLIPGLVKFFSLSANLSSWADEALLELNRQRPPSKECNTIVRNSPFAIENSAEQLINIYTGAGSHRSLADA